MRTVRESAAFSRSRQLIEPDAARFDEVFRAYEWAISLDAEAFPIVMPGLEGGPIRLLKTLAFPGVPAISIFFQIVDDDCCELLWMEHAPMAAEED